MDSRNIYGYFIAACLVLLFITFFLVRSSEAISEKEYKTLSLFFGKEELVVSPSRRAKPMMKAELFVTGHNIFNGSQYLIGSFRNPSRWIEGGLGIRFL